jgi:hypothetical protein
MSGLVLDALLIVVMLIALDWRESRWTPRSLSTARHRPPAMRRPAPLARRETLAAIDRKAS